MLIAILIIFVVFGLYACHAKKETAAPMASEHAMLAQLKQLEADLQHLNQEWQTDHQGSESEIKALTQQLKAIQSDLAALNTQDKSHDIQQLLTTESQTLSQQLATLQTQMAQIKKQVTPTAYLSETLLPFKVIGIDIWNSEPQATVKIQGTLDLMAKNDTRSGWTLIDLTFEPAEAIFKNTRNQLVKVTLP